MRHRAGGPARAARGGRPVVKRAARLEALAKEVRELEESPLYEYREEKGYRPVFGEGDPDAAIMFVGEAPGREEAETGRPFVGRAGQVLDDLLASVGLDREDVYITNVLKDRPPGNRDPHVEEIEAYAPFLRKQMAIIEPRVIAPLGRFATGFVLEQFGRRELDEPIGELHGEPLEAEAGYGRVTVVPLYHPAAGFYSPDLKDVMFEDFRVLRRFL